MKVIINGKETEIPENSTVGSVLAALEIKSSMLVVEKNLSIVDRENYALSALAEGDSLEIVGFFGGG